MSARELMVGGEEDCEVGEGAVSIVMSEERLGYELKQYYPPVHAMLFPLPENPSSRQLHLATHQFADHIPTIYGGDLVSAHAAPASCTFRNWNVLPVVETEN